MIKRVIQKYSHPLILQESVSVRTTVASAVFQLLLPGLQRKINGLDMQDLHFYFATFFELFCQYLENKTSNGRVNYEQ
jgi:hypothetical protein